MIDYFRMIRGLLEARIAFVVIGGVAARMQGSDYVTNDLDICYDTHTANVERLATLLAEWNAYLRGVDPDLPFIMDARQIRSTPIMTLRTDVGDIDILDRVDGVGDYTACRANADMFSVYDMQFAVLSLDALIDAKISAGRPKDRLLLPTLEALREIREAQGE